MQEEQPTSKPDQQPLTSAICELSEIVRIVMASQEQQTNTHERMMRRDLRWRNIRAALICVSVVGGALLYSLGLQQVLAPAKFKGPYAALVRVEGLIDAEQRANANKVNAALRSAFADSRAKGVVLLINSAGGSPVQSALIHDRLLSLRAQYPDKPVWAVGEDMLTSGAYFVAVAAQKVCVNRSTMTGSIGVVMEGWGLDRTINRWEIERRVFTAGSNKRRLDAFQPLRPQDQQKADQLLQAIHGHFIQAVKEGRGDRLKGEPSELFSGDYWTGQQAMDLGLVDGLCDLEDIIRTQLGVEQFKDYTLPPNLFARMANSFGVLVQSQLALQLSTAQPRLLP
jgi:protease IV